VPESIILALLALFLLENEKKLVQSLFFWNKGYIFTLYLVINTTKKITL
tara:strand:+ start:20545 stop:20691 length:147 start_codon:yes stop_codon:yes gene_type:complete